MGTPLAPIDCKLNDKVADKFLVKKKLGEGACGTVFLVCTPDSKGKMKYAAMKVEPRMKNKEDEILKMEIFAMKKLQKSRHVCKILAHGQTPTFTYIVMTLLGMELADLKKRCPNKKFSHSTSLRLGLQVVKGLQDIHEAGFVHRDIKPSNLAMGQGNSMVLYIFDFGLARQIIMQGNKLREERPKVMFRGTVRYCSLNVHNYKEQGRHDDLIAAMNSLIECTSVLPWKVRPRKEAAKLKANTSDKDLCKECPPSFCTVYTMLKKLKYADTPNYASIIQMLKGDLPPGVKMTDRYDWSKKDLAAVEDGPKSDRERAEADKDPTVDQQTVNDVDDSVVTEDEKESNLDLKEFAADDDTMDGM